MKTKFIIFIADNIRHGNFPRVDCFKHSYEFQNLPYNGTKLGERYFYHGRALTTEEFNAAQVRLFSPEFTGGQGFTFQSMAIEVADEAPGPVEQIVQRAAAAAESAGVPLPETIEVNIVVDTTADAVEPDAGIPASPAVLVDPVAEPVAPVAYTLTDRKIFRDGIHVAGLFGGSDQLRVLAAFQDLRPEIEAWLAGR